MNMAELNKTYIKVINEGGKGSTPEGGKGSTPEDGRRSNSKGGRRPNSNGGKGQTPKGRRRPNSKGGRGPISKGGKGPNSKGGKGQTPKGGRRPPPDILAAFVKGEDIGIFGENNKPETSSEKCITEHFDQKTSNTQVVVDFPNLIGMMVKGWRDMTPIKLMEAIDVNIVNLVRAFQQCGINCVACFDPNNRQTPETLRKWTERRFVELNNQKRGIAAGTVELCQATLEQQGILTLCPTNGDGDDAVMATARKMAEDYTGQVIVLSADHDFFFRYREFSPPENVVCAHEIAINDEGVRFLLRTEVTARKHDSYSKTLVENGTEERPDPRGMRVNFKDWNMRDQHCSLLDALRKGKLRFGNVDDYAATININKVAFPFLQALMMLSETPQLLVEYPVKPPLKEPFICQEQLKPDSTLVDYLQDPIMLFHGIRSKDPLKEQDLEWRFFSVAVVAARLHASWERLMHPERITNESPAMRLKIHLKHIMEHCPEFQPVCEKQQIKLQTFECVPCEQFKWFGVPYSECNGHVWPREKDNGKSDLCCNCLRALRAFLRNKKEEQ